MPFELVMKYPWLTSNVLLNNRDQVEFSKFLIVILARDIFSPEGICSNRLFSYDFISYCDLKLSHLSALYGTNDNLTFSLSSGIAESSPEQGIVEGPIPTHIHRYYVFLTQSVSRPLT